MKHLLSLSAVIAVVIAAAPNAAAYSYNYNYNAYPATNNLCSNYQNGRCIRYTSNRYLAPAARNTNSYNYNHTYPTYYYGNSNSRIPTYTTVQPAGQYRVYEYNDYTYNRRYNNEYNYTTPYTNYSTPYTNYNNYNNYNTYDYYNTYDSYYRW